MDFGWAINALKAGHKVTRKGWKQFLWLKPATNVPIQVCHDPVLKDLAFMLGGSIPATETISACFQDEDGKWFILTGWVPKPWDMFATDWEEYKMDAGKFGIVHCADTAERKAEAVAEKHCNNCRLYASPKCHHHGWYNENLEMDNPSTRVCGGWEPKRKGQAELDKLPKAGSMENCEKLSNAINQLLESIGVMPHLTVTLVPGPEDKELTIAIREKSENGEANYPIHVDGDMQIIHHEAIACYVINPDGITKSSIGGDTLNDKVED